jgi:hypothetical protein
VPIKWTAELPKRIDESDKLDPSSVDPTLFNGWRTAVEYMTLFMKKCDDADEREERLRLGDALRHIISRTRMRSPNARSPKDGNTPALIYHAGVRKSETRICG